jgi:hypothetical protein
MPEVVAIVRRLAATHSAVRGVVFAIIVGQTMVLR